jgi:beta-mannosidase
MRRLTLNGTWRYAPQAHQLLKPGGVIEEDAANLPGAGEMSIPANWQLGGLDNFHGRVRFERTFTFDGLQDGEASLWLIFSAVDYYARVWLNDVELGTHEGYFQPFEFDVTDVIRQGENRVVVDVACPKEEPETVWPSQKIMLKGILSHWDCRPGSWDYETGQDMNSGGIWGDVHLETRAATYIDHVRIQTRLVPGGVPDTFAITDDLIADELSKQAMVIASVETAGMAGDYRLRVSIGDEPPVEIDLQQRRLHETANVIIRIPDPRLWWTWDLGEPHLETCTVELFDGDRLLDRWTQDIGLREITLDPETGIYQLNGQRFFVRGTNVIPTLWLSEYDEAMIARDIDMLLASHVNSVRVCVHINRKEFYEACDRAGIIVWQDFAMQWGYAPTREVEREAARQIRDMVRLLVNHPCIALWVCQNESSFHNKFVLDPVLADIVAAEDPSRYVRPTSTFGEHTYKGWYYGDYHEYTSLPATPLLSEFGAQALPDLDSVRQMIGDTFPPDWHKLSYHDFQYHQTIHQAGVEVGSSIEEFISNSQAYQARLLKFAIEQYRPAKYRELGGMYQFMFMDCWNAITWSVVSYSRVPKQGYHALQQVYQPVLIGVHGLETVLSATDRWAHARPLTFKPWVVNDRHEPLTGCSYRASLEGAGQTIDMPIEETFDVPADGVLEAAPRLTWFIPDDFPPGTVTLRLELLHNGAVISENSYELVIVARLD